jgi:uncharacterized protein (DUF1778 family)
MRNTEIRLRATAEQCGLIDRASKVLGKSAPEFILEAACERAQAVVVDQVVFRLDEGRFLQFAALLDAPPKQNPALDRLLSVCAPWRTEAQ